MDISGGAGDEVDHTADAAAQRRGQEDAGEVGAGRSAQYVAERERVEPCSIGDAVSGPGVCDRSKL